jgi:hypothetical protein
MWGDGLAEARVTMLLRLAGSESNQSPHSPQIDTRAAYAAVREGVRVGEAERPKSVRFEGIMD